MNNLDSVTAVRAIESLRSGVPSAAAVRALGWPDEDQIERIVALLDSVDELAPRSLMVKGDFGTGKSHLLTFIEQLALSRDFIVSKIVVSKETSLARHDTVVNAAIRAGRIPGGRGSLLHELAPLIDFRSSAADPLMAWAAAAPGMVAASVRLLECANEVDDDKLINAIVDWWSGEKLKPSRIKSGLKQLGAQRAFDVGAISAARLAPLRVELTSLAIKAAGFSGWVILLDELELIGRYTRLQRARAYAELACWAGYLTPVGTSMVCVGTITDDFAEVILGPKGRHDSDSLVKQLKARDDDPAPALAGMALIDQEGALYLSGPDQSVLDHTYELVRHIYRTAFDWDPPEGKADFVSTTIPMRTYIKTWIYAWDLQRLGVTSRPTVQTESIVQSYEEDFEFDEAPDDAEMQGIAL